MKPQLLRMVEAALSQSNLEARINDAQGCVELLLASPCAEVDYHPLIIDYHQAYLNFADNSAHAFTLLLKLGNQTCGILPVMIRNYPTSTQLGSNSADSLPPFLISSLSRKQKRKLYVKCFDFIKALMINLELNTFTSQFTFIPGVAESWFALLNEKGAVSDFNQQLYCDLNVTEQDYLPLIRDKYRSHIKRAEKLWRVEVNTRVSDEQLAAFQALHLSVAGKRTRSDHSWQLQQEAVNNDAGFMVFAYDDTDELIGAALFNCTHYMASYAVGAYNRELFDLPISHIIHYRAIETMKSRGLSWYYIGARCNKNEWMKPTDKEWQIGHFKEGFSTHSFFNLRMCHDLINIS
jgi:FemAB family protein